MRYATKFAPRPALLASLLMAAGSVSSVRAQWTVVNLHPSWALSSELHGIEGGQQAGIANGLALAVLWQGSAASGTVLNPQTENAAMAQATSAGHQAGSITLDFNVASHAALWNGSSRSWSDLHPTDPAVIHSNILGMNAVNQVGSYFLPSSATFSAGRACIWSGTSGSWVNLNPTNLGIQSSEARGVFGTRQVGATFDSGLGTACMWNGTAESFVNLAPPDSFASVAQCADASYQYGIAAVLSPVPGIFPVRWNGTPESWQSMGVPEGLYGEILATSEGYQAGDTFDSNSENYRAVLWTAPGSFEDLHQYLPGGYTLSQGMGIWRHPASGTTYVAGYGFNSAANRNEAMLWVNGPGTNLMVSPGAPAECGAAVGQPMNFSIRILNAGPAASDPVTLTVDLPASSVATYSSAVPPPTGVTATQLTFNLPAVSGSGGFTDISLSLTAVGPGAVASITATASSDHESDPTNNTASTSARILPSAPDVAAAQGVISTVTTQANSLIPGASGGHYTALARPIASASGNYWIAGTQCDLPAAQQRVLVRAQTGNAATTIVQQGITAVPHGTITIFDNGAEVNDSGQVAFAASDNGTASSARFIAVSNGASITEVARAGQPIPSMAGINYGTGVGVSANIFNNGQVGFYTTSSPSGSSGYLANNGSSIIARLNITIPGGASVPIDTMVSNASGTGTLQFDATGTHSIYQADINTGSSANDQVIVADGTVVMQENTTILPGLTSPVDGNNKLFFMGSSGTWLVRGANSIVSEQWVARGNNSAIAQVFKNGDPLFIGSSESWTATFITGVSTATFFSQAADASGNYVLGGYSNSGDTFTNSVLVLNNQQVIARENDPVDLNGNGIFDDGMYIRSFDTDAIAFIQGAVLVTVTLRDEVSALCHSNNTSRGQAIIRIPLPSSCYANCDASSVAPILNANDFQCFLNKFAAADPYANCDNSSVAPILNANDFQCFLNAYAAGCS